MQINKADNKIKGVSQEAPFCIIACWRLCKSMLLCYRNKANNRAMKALFCTL